jgi:hypothetical protein
MNPFHIHVLILAVSLGYLLARAQGAALGAVAVSTFFIVTELLP